jgi:uncharacterized sulfatase
MPTPKKNMHYSRRRFLKTIGITAAGLIAGGCEGGFKQAPEKASRRKPNFVLIFADDLGYGDISGFGFNNSGIQTPNLAKMADEGARLTSFYVPMPYCAPSRAAILTGRYPFRSGVVFNPSPDNGVNELGLPTEEITIAEALRKAGYKSSCIGKWHLGHTPKFLPRTQGFDEYFGILYSNDMRPVQLVENETVLEYPVAQVTLTKRYTKRAMKFIEENSQKDQPFFLYLAHAMPHKPLAASEEFYTPETPDDLYADVIRELDFSVGLILDKLKALGIDDNTMVMFTSDNGPWHGGSTGGLRGMKGKTWEGGTRVPFIARWPGMIGSGVVNNSIAGTIDVFPTIAKAADVRLSVGRVYDGKDILPLLQSADAKSPHKALFGMMRGKLMTIRSGKWKLHVQSPGRLRTLSDDWVDPRGPDGVTILAPYEQPGSNAYPGLIGGDKPKAMMLFDMEADPYEQNDVSEKHPTVLKRLMRFYDDMAAQVPTLKAPLRNKTQRRLKGGALEYND